MDAIKFVCIALVVGVIGPLFWLCVKVLELKFWAGVESIRRRVRASRAEKAAAAHQRLLQ